jgi:hypothetical protein
VSAAGTPGELAAVVAATGGYVQAEGPNEAYPPGGYVMEEDRRWYIEAALAGIELGQWDRRIIDWLAQWDDCTTRVVVSLLVRARRAGYAEAATRPGGSPHERRNGLPAAPVPALRPRPPLHREPREFRISEGSPRGEGPGVR